MKKILFGLILTFISALTFAQGKISVNTPFDKNNPLDNTITGYERTLNGVPQIRLTKGGRDSISTYFTKILKTGVTCYVSGVDSTYRWNGTAWINIGPGNIRTVLSTKANIPTGITQLGTVAFSSPNSAIITPFTLLKSTGAITTPNSTISLDPAPVPGLFSRYDIVYYDTVSNAYGKVTGTSSAALPVPATPATGVTLAKILRTVNDAGTNSVSLYQVSGYVDLSTVQTITPDKIWDGNLLTHNQRLSIPSGVTTYGGIGVLADYQNLFLDGSGGTKGVSYADANSQYGYVIRFPSGTAATVIGNYGPYAPLQNGEYTAEYHMRTSDTSAAGAVQLRVTRNGPVDLNTLNVTNHNFSAPNTWQTFKIHFTASKGFIYEFRSFITTTLAANIDIDYINVFPDNIVSTDELNTALATKQNVIGYTPENIANKNQNNGYAGLDANNKISPSQLGFGSGDANMVLHGDGTFSGINATTQLYGIVPPANGGVLPPQSLQVGQALKVNSTRDGWDPYTPTSSADLAAKQNLITVTTTGSSGPSTFNQTTGALNIPQYSGNPGTVTSFGKTDGIGITSTVSNPTTTPVHSIALDTTVAKTKTSALADYNILAARIAQRVQYSDTTAASSNLAHRFQPNTFTAKNIFAGTQTSSSPSVNINGLEINSTFNQGASAQSFNGLNINTTINNGTVVSITNPGTGYTDGTYYGCSITGLTGYYATITILSGSITSVVIDRVGTGAALNTNYTSAISPQQTGTGFTFQFYNLGYISNIGTQKLFNIQKNGTDLISVYTDYLATNAPMTVVRFNSFQGTSTSQYSQNISLLAGPTGGGVFRFGSPVYSTSTVTLNSTLNVNGTTTLTGTQILSGGSGTTSIASQSGSNPISLLTSVWNGSASITRYTNIRTVASNTTGLAYRLGLYVASTNASDNIGGIESMSLFSTGRVGVNSTTDLGGGNLMIGTGSATQGQEQFATQSTAVTPSATTVGAHWWDGSNMNIITSANTSDKYAYQSQLPGFLTLTASGTGSATTISIAHGLTGVTATSKVFVTAKNAASAGWQYVTTDATNINITYSTAPASGTNNLSFDVEIKP